MRIYTIGFAQSTAERFFERLREASVERVLDVRLKRDSQLAGFAKARDLPWFLRELAGIDYEHEPLLAPTEELFVAYRREQGPFAEFARSYEALLAERQVERHLDAASFRTPTALLCSEPTAEHCHRRLALEHLARHWEGVEAVHL